MKNWGVTHCTVHTNICSSATAILNCVYAIMPFTWNVSSSNQKLNQYYVTDCHVTVQKLNCSIVAAQHLRNKRNY